MNEIEERLQSLSEITKVLLDPEDYFQEIRNNLQNLKQLLTSVSGLDMESEVYGKQMYLNTGMALGTKWAAMCVEDILRTKRFISAVHKAVRDVKKRKPDAPAVILYAGTGPFATLVLPLITIFSPEELQLILLEVNADTIQLLKKTLEGFNAKKYVKALHQCDASEFEVTQGEEVDILLVECLQHALEKEPQVAITYNLLSQLKADTILIPSEISLHLALLDSKAQYDHTFDLSGNNKQSYYAKSPAVFLLNKEKVLDDLKRKKYNAMEFERVTTKFTQAQIMNKNMLAILTEMVLYNDEKLMINNSGLTIPKYLDRAMNGNFPEHFVSQYKMGKEPTLEVTY